MTTAIRMFEVVALALWAIVGILRVGGGLSLDAAGPLYALPCDLFVVALVIRSVRDVHSRHASVTGRWAGAGEAPVNGPLQHTGKSVASFAPPRSARPS